MRVSTKVLADVIVDNTGTTISIPVLVTDEGVLWSFAEYLKTYRNKSATWKDKAVLSMQLLLEYVLANEDAFDDKKEMFQEFSNSLFTGTVDEHGNDPSWLRWKPRRAANAKAIIGHITHYTDWLATIKEDEGLSLNPYRRADNFEQQMHRAAYFQRRQRAFHSHLWKFPEAIAEIRRSRWMESKTPRDKGSGNKSDSPAKAFPDNHIDELLDLGFVRYGKDQAPTLTERCSLQNLCITLLMLYGGVRLSETMHIFVEDIEPTSDGSCIVRIFHPENGIAPDGKGTRLEYLKKKFGLKPRNHLPSSASQFAGWKHPRITDDNNQSFEVLWFPAVAGKLFRKYWNLYLANQRTVNPHRKHPYAFSGTKGNPMSIRSFKKSFKRAVERIGLTPQKALGTTPHGCRHAYGQRCREAEIDSATTMVMMHHQSIESQQVYKEPPEKAVRKRLEAIDQRLTVAAQNRLISLENKINNA